jgi:predicted RNA-binding Zn ribbon-like protein
MAVTGSRAQDDSGLPLAARFLGGPVCLDFANTTEQLRTSRPDDWLTSYAVLLTWSQARGTLDVDAVKRLARRTARQPSVADEAFSRALAIRADIRKLAAALADGKSTAEAMRGLNTWLRTLPRQPPITLAGGIPGRFELRGDHPDEPLWPVLWSVTALLTSDDITRVRRCEGQGCGYYFVDTTLNRSRRFCSTAGCGNRARARRHHERQRAGSLFR